MSSVEEPVKSVGAASVTLLGTRTVAALLLFTSLLPPAFSSGRVQTCTTPSLSLCSVSMSRGERDGS